jgi:release factor glutamine methyltransferase
MVTLDEAVKNLVGILTDHHYPEREAGLIVKYLVEDVLGSTTGTLLTDLQANLLEQVAGRLKAGEPWQYISGKAHFYGKDFIVNQNVLIPRMETEELVYNALQFVPHRLPCRILDIGTGSGIIALTMGIHRPDALITGIDISPEALEIAEKNRQQLQVPNVSFLEMDFLDEKNWPLLPEFDLMVSNPPYIDTNEKARMSPSTVSYEPHQALFTRLDPMEFYAKMAEFVINRGKQVRLLAEINEFRSVEVKNVFSIAGFQDVDIIKDLQGKDRIVHAVFTSDNFS